MIYDDNIMISLDEVEKYGNIMNVVCKDLNVNFAKSLCIDRTLCHNYTKKIDLIITDKYDCYTLEYYEDIILPLFINFKKLDVINKNSHNYLLVPFGNAFKYVNYDFLVEKMKHYKDKLTVSN